MVDSIFVIHAMVKPKLRGARQFGVGDSVVTDQKTIMDRIVFDGFGEQSGHVNRLDCLPLRILGAIELATTLSDAAK